MKNKLVERFIKLIKFNTESDDNSITYPSTISQTKFLETIVKQECSNIGLSNIKIHNSAYLTATLPSNSKKDIPTIGFLAHIDTSPSFSGENINPKIIENYNGEDIVLESGLVTSVKEFKYLKDLVGKTIITTDGNTLLGADDKAGMAEILSAMEYLINNKDIEHGEIVIAFTNDEEIGEGVKKFDVKEFGADFAYTIDGGGIGELEFESFNAGRAKINITGKSVHPGTAKDIMVNANLIGSEFIEMLPKNEVPEKTDGYEGFYMVNKIVGSITNCYLDIIIRDHDKDNFNNRKEFIKTIIKTLNEKYGNKIELDLFDQYYNMGEVISKNYFVVEKAEDAFLKAEVEPKINPIRGGTDGSILSFMGLPCPNIFMGGYNYHGPHEMAVVEYMEKAVEVIINICKV